ncbi:MAG: hypothetical protein HFF17_00970 [Oscillospiraceae bacterium]|nr:hypothetical protein [Oscillospiraceae bacterium]
MSSQLEALLDRSESLKRDLEDTMAQMCREDDGGEAVESFQSIRDSILDQLDKAICGVTALMAWAEDYAQTS